jgi:ketosteroid isomerase-like protein
VRAEIEAREEGMSDSDIRALEQIYANWAQGNFWEFESFDEDVRARWATEVPDMVSSEAEEFRHAGDRIVAFVRVYGRGSGSSIDVEMENAHVWTMRDGQALAIRAYSDRERAMREVGLG